ncbi:MAG: tRNA adenosine(34) deaminase TadA [Thermodesulfobacteriota bacterium]
MLSDVQYMQRALFQAEKAAACGEVPVGAVLIDAAGHVLAEACNQPIGRNDPTAHAEILVMRAAAADMGNYRLLNTTLYVTLEPCAMCMGAVIHARIDRVVFGAGDPKWGGCGSVYDFAADRRFNHCPEITRGVCETRCRELMVHFFRSRRNNASAAPRP